MGYPLFYIKFMLIYYHLQHTKMKDLNKRLLNNTKNPVRINENSMKLMKVKFTTTNFLKCVNFLKNL
ncbi:hypothetical protein C1145_02715 [Clostridium botulinum]|nr:hypothetical protein C1145_02715 [Clostridium botulinum]